MFLIIIMSLVCSYVWFIQLNPKFAMFLPKSEIFNVSTTTLDIPYPDLKIRLKIHQNMKPVSSLYIFL